MAASLALAAALAISGHAGASATHAAHSTTSRASTPSTTTETIHTTANHPWLTADRGWVAAGELRPGEAVVTLSGGTSTVAWVQVVPGQADYYNLTVAKDHTYAVGSGEYVVHNCNDVGELRRQYVVDNIDTLAPGARAPGEVPDISEEPVDFPTNKAGNRDIYKPDIKTSKAFFEVGGPAKYADPTDDQIPNLSKAAAFKGVKPYLALDVTDQPVPPSMVARATRWGIQIIEFTLP